MNICRICLSSSTEKDIRELKFVNDGTWINYKEIFHFCLNIQIEADFDVNTKLCSSCYDKVLLFYEFKSLALKSDSYLKSGALPEPEVFIKHDIILKCEAENEKIMPYDIKLENPHFDANEGFNTKMTLECVPPTSVKQEVSDEDDQFQDLSDDELLIDVKRTKDENVVEKKTEKNAPTKQESIKKPQQNSDQCEECGKTVKNMKRHRRMHQPPGVREQFECEECDKTFLTAVGKTAHYKLKHLQVKKECPICKKQVADLRQHTLMKHDQSSMRLVCVVCERRFLRRAHLDAHMLSHTKDRPFQCDICPSNFTTKVALMRHKQVMHDNERPFMCQFCSKRFLLKAQLEIHVRSHTKERPFECTECDKNFSDPYTYKKHIKLHSSARVECKLCKKSLSVTSVNSHMKSHTKETPYSCKYCSSKFTRSSHCKRHERNIHERKMHDVQPTKSGDTDEPSDKADKI